MLGQDVTLLNKKERIGQFISLRQNTRPNMFPRSPPSVFNICSGNMVGPLQRLNGR